MTNPGDKVTIQTKEKEIMGILMPSASKDSTFIKLDNGYNIGISNSNIQEIKLVEKASSPKVKKDILPHKKGKKTIMVLHTGGTIASKVDYTTGGVTAKFTAQDLVKLVPELKEIANIECDLVANMMSEDMNFSDYQKIAKEIKKHKVDGIIIGHGTDTLAYTSAALSFMFEKINIPVILVGSQRSSDRGSSDAALNLISAATFIAETDFIGIAVCMHHTSNDNVCAILPPTKSRKMHSSRRDSFKAINDTPIALIEGKKIKFLKDYQAKSKDDEIILKDKFSNEVALVKSYPNMKKEAFEYYTKNYQALVFEGTGLGHLPTNTKENEQNYKILTKYIEKGGIVAITTQCIFGMVHSSVYSNLRRLSNIGCIFCQDMIPETAYIKLSWLLANSKEAKELLNKNLRGEILKRNIYKDDFLE